MFTAAVAADMVHGEIEASSKSGAECTWDLGGNGRTSLQWVNEMYGLSKPRLEFVLEVDHKTLHR